MRFAIEKTSEGGGISPCSGAVKTISSLGPGDNLWVVEISTLEELVALAKREKGPLILTEGTTGLRNLPDSIDGWLEIYDDWRE